MLKKMLVVAAVLAVVSPAFGTNWKSNFSKDVPSKTIVDENGDTVPNPAYDAFVNDGANWDRTVDWEKDLDNNQTLQRKGEVWNWPAEYQYVPIGEVPVKMEVGFWIKLNCKDKYVKLQQRAITEYGGSTTCKVSANTATQWKADLVLNDLGNKLGADKAVALDPSSLPAGKDKNLTIKVKLWKVNLQDLTASKDCQEIGKVILKVRPDVSPNTFMSGCTGSYPVYSPPPTNSDITWW